MQKNKIDNIIHRSTPRNSITDELINQVSFKKKCIFALDGKELNKIHRKYITVRTQSSEERKMLFLHRTNIDMTPGTQYDAPRVILKHRGIANHLEISIHVAKKYR